VTRLLQCVPVVCLLTGCATDGAAERGASLTLLATPDEHCTSLGPVAVRMPLELMMPEDALLSTATTELRRRAALRGATHLVITTPPSAAMIAYGTTAAATGLALRCSEEL